MKKTIFIFLMILLGFTVHANAALVDNGDGTITDTDRGLMWLQDANYAMTSGYDSDGQMLWQAAVDWADSLVFAGYDDWRLPSNLQPDPTCSVQDAGWSGILSSGYNCTGDALGHLFYEELGGEAYTHIYDVHNSNYNLFTNMSLSSDPKGQSSYWTGTEEPLHGNAPWVVVFDGGYKDLSNKYDAEYRAIAVRVVPEPISSILFVTGGTLLVGRRYIKRRKKA